MKSTGTKSTGTQSLKELQWLDSKIGHQDSGSSNDHQGNILPILSAQ